MATVLVKNLNSYPLVEKFKGRTIELAPAGHPGDSIKMDSEEAHQYKCQFKPPVLDGDGNGIAKGFKMLAIVPLEAVTEPVLPPEAALKCLACKYVAANSADLEEHAKAAHSAQLVVDEEAEEAIKVTKAKKKVANVQQTTG